MPITHLMILWLVVLGAAGITVGLFASFGTPALIVPLLAALGLQLWNRRK